MHWQNATTSYLNRFVNAERPGIITDMDGTISPIVDQPDAAQPTQRSRQLLHDLQQVFALVAVVSGRSAADVSQRVGLPDLIYVGNHGLERWEEGELIPDPLLEGYRPQVKAAVDQLQPQLLPGMTLEDKGATLTVHYRQTTEPAAIVERFRPVAEAAAAHNDLEMYEGRMIFELRPPITVNKGTALRRLVEDFGLDAALYIGDDTTDVDALVMARKLRQEARCYALAAGVQSEDTPEAVVSNADFTAEGVSDVESLLSWLLEARKASST